MTLALLLLACTTGSVTLGDKEGDDTGSPTTDDTGSPGDDTGDTQDTQDTEPQGHPYAGTYEGVVGWEVPEWDWLVCEWDITLEVDDEGAMAGDTICEYLSDNGQTYDLFVDVQGEVSEDGEVSGEIVFDTWDSPGRGWEINEYDAELTGDISSRGNMATEFYTAIDMGRDGDFDLFGWVEVELQ
ncbi:MAG: hypothetical protein H6741_20460 [Alphaproteobacteria bacterium]|nr:hypothetical protein [Alphaproteobacteria bacterium]